LLAWESAIQATFTSLAKFVAPSDYCEFGMGTHRSFALSQWANHLKVIGRVAIAALSRFWEIVRLSTVGVVGLLKLLTMGKWRFLKVSATVPLYRMTDDFRVMFAMVVITSRIGQTILSSLWSPENLSDDGIRIETKF